MAEVANDWHRRGYTRAVVPRRARASALRGCLALDVVDAGAEQARAAGVRPHGSVELAGEEGLEGLAEEALAKGIGIKVGAPRAALILERREVARFVRRGLRLEGDVVRTSSIAGARWRAGRPHHSARGGGDIVTGWSG